VVVARMGQHRPFYLGIRIFKIFNLPSKLDELIVECMKFNSKMGIVDDARAELLSSILPIPPSTILTLYKDKVKIKLQTLIGS
jgi:hypothetical protein